MRDMARRIAAQGWKLRVCISRQRSLATQKDADPAGRVVPCIESPVLAKPRVNQAGGECMLDTTECFKQLEAPTSMSRGRDEGGMEATRYGMTHPAPMTHHRVHHWVLGLSGWWTTRTLGACSAFTWHDSPS